MKIGNIWGSKIYMGLIKEIEFIHKKKYIVPKAIIEPVHTGGNSVTNVPLYNIGVMNKYNYVPGEYIYFKYGGEQGVTTVDSFGNSVSSGE